jgi:hypothetical protein
MIQPNQCDATAETPRMPGLSGSSVTRLLPDESFLSEELRLASAAEMPGVSPRKPPRVRRFKFWSGIV